MNGFSHQLKVCIGIKKNCNGSGKKSNSCTPNEFSITIINLNGGAEFWLLRSLNFLKEIVVTIINLHFLNMFVVLQVKQYILDIFQDVISLAKNQTGML
jgi:hypothetical protein